VFTSTVEPHLWYDDPLDEWGRRIREFGTFVRYSAQPAASEPASDAV
jgi:hypothetical protein